MPNAAIHVHTLGTETNAVIVSVGIVVFDEKQVLSEKLYVADIENQPGRIISPRSIRWWMEQDAESRKVFESNGWDLNRIGFGLSNDLKNVDGIVLISRHDRDILSSCLLQGFYFLEGAAVSFHSLDEMLRFWGITSDEVRVCPKSYNALLAAQADAATLRACWTLVNEAQSRLIA